MALMNRKLNSRLETIFMIPRGAYSYLSSGLVREISALGGSVSNLVPAVVERKLKEKLRASSRKSKSKQA
jgi:pantetheine-phosphate adenylyltransferase